MKNRFLKLFFLFFVPFLLVNCSGSQNNCPPKELEDYLRQSNLTIETFQGLLGEGTNHPEQKSEVAEKMRTLKNDLDLSTPPKCATKYQTLVSEAMRSSLTFLILLKTVTMNLLNLRSLLMKTGKRQLAKKPGWYKNIYPLEYFYLRFST